MKKYILSILILFLLSCSYSVRTMAYPHLKTIQIEQFQNQSDEFELSEELFIKLSDYFQADGRLRLVTEDADCILEGEIRDYTDKIYSYEGSTVKEYQVKIMFWIKFTDLTTEEVLWENSNLILSETYSQTDETAEYSTAEEARLSIYEDLFDNIIKNTLEQW
ncbi:MAG: hypothetical protein PWQ09_390 [Candidatus Cloacimonadota bacterium]|nr:hypothetical protein [Candidatus Cloacimonadota bacterium]